MRLSARAAVYFAGALVVLGLVERGAKVLVSRRLLVSAGAEWIWAPGPLERPDGLAFYAARDFELDAPPSRAHIDLQGDESYILYVNGWRVGSGGWAPGAPLDTYGVGDLLRPGWNRIAVEMRSARGAGGLLLALHADDRKEPLIASGADWRIFRDAPGVVDGTRPLDDGEPARVWQQPPTGRWGIPRLAPERPTFDEAVAAGPGRLEALALEPSTELLPTSPSDPPLIVDFGRPVTGYLLVRGLADAPRHLRLELGVEPVLGETVDLLLTDGQTTWSTAEVHTLRYVGAPFLPEGVTLSLIPVEPDLAARDEARAERRRTGVFGVEPPLHDAHLDVGF